MNLLKYSLIVILIVITVVLCGCCVRQYCAVVDTFTATSSNAPYYDVHTPVYVRRNNMFCYYKANIIALPTKANPYYTVSYQEGDQNPNGSKVYTEAIPQSDTFVYTDNTLPNPLGQVVLTTTQIQSRLQKRILRNETTDLLNSTFVEHQAVAKPHPIFASRLPLNILFCYPRKLNDALNFEYPLKVSTADVEQAHQALISQIMGGIEKMTFLNVYSVYINNAPSPISDKSLDSDYTPKYTGPSYRNTSGCPNQLVATHPDACAVRYKLPTPLRLHMGLVGSDLNGSVLQMFYKKMLQMQTSINDAYGPNSVMNNYIEHFQDAMHSYSNFRQHVTIAELKTQFSPVLKSTSVATANMYRLMVDALIHLRSSTHTQLQYNTVPNTFDGVNNRMFLVPLTFIPNYTPSDATVKCAQYFCEHDSVLSIGAHNTDVTAEVSYAAKQNTTVCRLSFSQNTNTAKMLSQTLVSQSVIEKDAYFLSVWLHFFMVGILDVLLQKVSQMTANPTSHSHSHSHTHSGLASLAKQTITNSIVQLFSILTGIPITILETDPAFQQFQKNDTIRSTDAQQLTQKYLFAEPQPTAARSVRKIDWSIIKPISTSALQQSTFSQTIPWNNVVYGTAATLNYGASKTFDIQTGVFDRSIHTVGFKVTHAQPGGWKNAVQLYLNKRIISNSVVPSNYMQRVFVGTQTFGRSAYAHLNSDVVYSLFPQNVTTSTDRKYYNGQKYKASDGQCYRVTCPAAPSRLCCAKKTSVGSCPPAVIGAPIPCKEPVVTTFANQFGACHSDNFDRSVCDRAFTEMIENCRNGVLIIEPENESVGIAPFLEYITDATLSAVRLQLLNKMVKTLVLKMYEFGSTAFTVVPSSTSDPALNTLARISRALQSLFHYYIVVGVHSPFAVNTNGTKQNPTPYVSTIKKTMGKTPTVMYQSYKCVTLTFRRIYENSVPFLKTDSSLISVAQLRSYIKNKNFTFIREYTSPTSNDSYMDVIEHLCHPYMTETLRYFNYYPTDTTYKPATNMFGSKVGTTSATHTAAAQTAAAHTAADKKKYTQDAASNDTEHDQMQREADTGTNTQKEASCNYEIKITPMTGSSKQPTNDMGGASASGFNTGGTKGVGLGGASASGFNTGGTKGVGGSGL